MAASSSSYLVSYVQKPMFLNLFKLYLSLSSVSFVGDPNVKLSKSTETMGNVELEGFVELEEFYKPVTR